MLAIYLKLKYGDFLLIDIVYENGPIKFFCISAVLMVDVSIDTGLRTFLHLISIYKYIGFVVFDVFDRQGNFYTQSYLHAIWLLFSIFTKIRSLQFLPVCHTALFTFVAFILNLYHCFFWYCKYKFVRFAIGKEHPK